MTILYRWILSAVALYVTVIVGQHLGLQIYIDPGIKAVIPAVIAVALLAIVNATIRPIVQLVALPVTCLTFGLFSLVINGFMFWLVGQFVPGFHVRGLLAPIYGSAVMGLLSGILNTLLISDDDKDK